MYPQILFEDRQPDRILTLDEYREKGGYQALATVLKEYEPDRVIDEVQESGLRGLGGAGFPTGKKWISVPEDAPFPRYIAVNADEMEPGTFKDRVLMHANPHAILEGIIISAYAVTATKGFYFIRPSYENAARILEREIDIARQAGYLGENILGSGFSFDLVLHRSGGRYICGEATAMLNAIMGCRPNPIKPPPYPTVKGLWNRATVVNNVETFAYVPYILRNGADWFRGLAKTENAAGNKLFCVSGHVNTPGCFELPMGIPLKEIIEDFAGGMRDGNAFKACLPGGASTRYLSREHYEIPMDFASLEAVGHRLGTAAIMVFDHTSCMVGATLNLLNFFARESCGWCTPCREGLPYLKDLFWRLEHGEGEMEFVPLIREMTEQLWNSYCAFAPGAAAPIEGLMMYFEDEVYEHIRQRKCPFGH